MKKRILTLGTFLLGVAAIAQVDVTIDKRTQFQTIEGFGGNIEYYVDSQRSKDVVISDKHANDIVNDLGATIFRHLIDGSMEIVNDNNDPFDTDLSKYNIRRPESATMCEGNVHYPLDIAASSFKKVKNLVAANGDTAKIYSTVFSPQYWTKYVKCVIGVDEIWNRMATDEEEKAKGGTLGVNGIKDFKDEFAEFCYAYIKLMENQGVTVDAFSIQNEPAFAEPYSSAVYSPESYGAVFKRVGQRLRANGLNTRMIFTEDIGDLGRYQRFIRIIYNDPVTLAFSDIAAVHSYGSNGITAGSTDATLWKSLGTSSRLKNPNRSFWQTETSGYKDHRDIAIAIYTALKYGQANAWMHHQLFTDGGLLDEGKDYKNFQYYGCKHFFKFVKQGAKSISATASEEPVLATAFQDDKRKTLTIVLINADTVNSKSVKLNFLQAGSLPSNYTMYLTTKETETTAGAANLCNNKGMIAPNATITLPARGVITLVGENSQPEIISALDDSQEANQKFLIYPNPSDEGFYIKNSLQDGKVVEVSILDLQGVEIKKLIYPSDGQELYISNSGIENGVYMLKYNNQYQKLVINK